ncbi:MAG: diaminopimelate epimerase [Nitratireductor sp.]|nr:diaminopimelate epimerase [Nitratireductor sp.]MCB1458385.1 diaminopimelate epimerase [Nitratireductor sp.]
MSDNRAAFVKMNGIGNKIIVADMRGRSDTITAAAAVRLAGRDAIPFDQIMEVRDPQGKDRDFDIRILNSDGSQAEACGNGTRCVVAWLHRQDGRSAYSFVTRAGLVPARISDDGRISVDMGVPRFGWQDIPLAEEFYDTRGIELQIGPIDAPVLHTPSVASMGNPHAVFWVSKDVREYDLARFGPMLENHPIFPERANITIAQVASRDRIIMRTWERGAGITLACGSAACATLACAVRKDLTNNVATMVLPGGELLVEWREDRHIIMTGPAEFEFAGMLDPATGEFDLEAEPVS